MGGVEIEISNSRIWLLRYPSAFHLKDFRQLFVDMRRLNPERIRHTTLIDIRDMNPWSADAAARREAAAVIQENLEFLRATMVAEARIAPNPLLRGVLTVFDWGSRQPWAVNNLPSGYTAELWLRSQLVREGIEVPHQPAWTTSPASRSA